MKCILEWNEFSAKRYDTIPKLVMKSSITCTFVEVLDFVRTVVVLWGGAWKRALLLSLRCSLVAPCLVWCIA
eukprot:4909129-Amphidinium_carterae.1